MFLDFVVSNFCFRTAGEEFGSQWLRPSPLRKVSLSRVKVCIELVGICKAPRGAEFGAIPHHSEPVLKTQTSLLNLFRNPARDGSRHLAGSEAIGLCDHPVMHAGDGEGSAFHDGAVAVERDFFRGHGAELEQA